MSDSDVDRILRAVHGARQKPATVKFNKEKFLKALNESLIDRFPRLIPPGRSGLFVYRGDLPLDRIARGMAAAGKRPTNIIRLQSEDLQRGEGWKLLEPLLHGSMLIVLDEGASSIGANLAAYWPRFADNPKGYAAPITKTLMLDRRLSIESPGAVVVVQRTSTNKSRHDLMEWPLIEEDAVALTTLADSWTGKIATIGNPPSERITFSNNEEAYRAYRALVSDIVAAGQGRILAETIAGEAIRGADALNLEISFHANKIWMQRYRIPPAQVVSGVASFVDELRELAPTVLGAAFAGPEDHRELVLQALADDGRWRFYDLRTATAEKVRKSLPELVKGGVAVVAADPHLEPDPLRNLAEAIADETPFRLGGKPLRIASDSVIVFVFGEGKLYSALGAPDGIAYAMNIDGLRAGSS
jgi:hypothetical protein